MKLVLSVAVFSLAITTSQGASVRPDGCDTKVPYLNVSVSSPPYYGQLEWLSDGIVRDYTKRVEFYGMSNAPWNLDFVLGAYYGVCAVSFHTSWRDHIPRTGSISTAHLSEGNRYLMVNFTGTYHGKDIGYTPEYMNTFNLPGYMADGVRLTIDSTSRRGAILTEVSIYTYD